jgi:general stress protein YciG
MSPEKRKEIAALGGKAAHRMGRAHEFTPEEARHAGRKGGQSISQDRAHMAEIGRKGGMARGKRQAEAVMDAHQPEGMG